MLGMALSALSSASILASAVPVGSCHNSFLAYQRYACRVLCKMGACKTVAFWALSEAF